MRVLAAVAGIPLVVVTLLVALARTAAERPPPTPTAIRVAADGCGGRPEADCRLAPGCRGSYGPSSISGGPGGSAASADRVFKGCAPDRADP